jgi:hypothetical protein
MDSRQRITRKNLIGDIDALMTDLSAEDAPAQGETVAPEETPKQRTTIPGLVILAAVIIASWLPVALALL